MNDFVKTSLLWIILIGVVVMILALGTDVFKKETTSECQISKDCPLGKVKWYVYRNSIPQLPVNNFQEQIIDSTTNTAEKARAWVLSKMGISTDLSEQCSAAFMVYPHLEEGYSGTTSGSFFYGTYPHTTTNTSESTIMTMSDPTKLPWYQWDTFVFSGIGDIIPLNTQP